MQTIPIWIIDQVNDCFVLFIRGGTNYAGGFIDHEVAGPVVLQYRPIHADLGELVNNLLNIPRYGSIYCYPTLC